MTPRAKVTALLSLLLSGLAAAADTQSPIHFSRDIRPILSDKCFLCHGPDKGSRDAGLRLDTREGATADLGGYAAVSPGKSADSELYLRIIAEEKYLLMPPAKSGKKLTPHEIALLKRWIDEGAPWQGHWSFIPPEHVAPPEVAGKDWCRNPVDRFILARLESQKHTPSPEAPRHTLLRRVSFDLTGLPPTPDEAAAFAADTRPGAYERAVDRLLASPRYGEHMGRYWLDAARYGDTHGLHLDNYREMWPYRDQVIRAFNDNMPYDRFLHEQLAGDLLPNATLAQKIASGFNRAHVTTNEGGVIYEEVYVRNVKDRVDTVGTVFLGLTLGCASCHDHKFDPITSRDYYSMFAFFNNLDGSAMDGNNKVHAPVVKVPSKAQAGRLASLDADIIKARSAVDARIAALKKAAPKEKDPKEREVVWIDDALPKGAKPEGGWQFVTAPGHPVASGTKASTRTATGLSQHFFQGANPPLPVSKGDLFFVHVYLDPKKPPRQIMLQWNDGSWEHRAYWGENLIPWGKDNSPSRRPMGPLPEKGKWVRLEIPAEKVGLKPGARINGWAFTQFDGTVYWDKAGVVTSGRPDPANHPSVTPLQKKVDALMAEQKKLNAAIPTTLVFKERAKLREAFILNRGEYDQHGEKVTRATPGFLPPMDGKLPRNRLGLARWLTDPRHPLTARVTVNRLWQQCFGTGLVKTAEDFGSQGEWPSHPRLLDWMAAEFIRTGWNVKQFMKMLVTSATYRQSSRVRPAIHKQDPQNRLYARGPRFRLDAEMIRDQALFASGLLVEKLGGPGVKPPQPDGLWFAVGYTSSNTARFKKDTGPDKVYRRTVYTFWKRTAPPPQLGTFDAPSRESCTVRRERTNTPLQALLLLNDPQYIEAARHLAQHALRTKPDTIKARAAWLFARLTLRLPSSEECAELAGVYRDHHAHFSASPDNARALIAIGESPPDSAMDPVELAAWTMTASLVLNLDEVITKE